jgi:hypothetical protein
MGLLIDKSKESRKGMQRKQFKDAEHSQLNGKKRGGRSAVLILERKLPDDDSQWT